jgi:hypothetical protein
MLNDDNKASTEGAIFMIISNKAAGINNTH